MTEAIVFVRIEPDFILRNERMLALSYEAKGLYIILWTMPMDRVPRTEVLSWSSTQQMLHVLAAMEQAPNIEKIERLLLEIEAQGLIQIVQRDRQGGVELAGISENSVQGVKRITGNSLRIVGFRVKHPGLNWRSNRGRKKGNSSQTFDNEQVRNPENFPSISHVLPDNIRPISIDKPENFPPKVPAMCKIRSDQIISDQIISDQRISEHEQEGPHPPDDVRCDDKANVRVAPPKAAWREQDAEIMRRVYSLLSSGSKGEAEAMKLVGDRLGISNQGKGLIALSKMMLIEPQRVAEYIYSAIKEGENPAGLFMSYMKTKPDFGGTWIYEDVKAILFGVTQNQIDNLKSIGAK